MPSELSLSETPSGTDIILQTMQKEDSFHGRPLFLKHILHFSEDLPLLLLELLFRDDPRVAQVGNFFEGVRSIVLRLSKFVAEYEAVPLRLFSIAVEINSTISSALRTYGILNEPDVEFIITSLPVKKRKTLLTADTLSIFSIGILNEIFANGMRAV